MILPLVQKLITGLKEIQVQNEFAYDFRPIRTGEHVMGVLPDYLKKLFALWVKSAKAFDEYFNKHKKMLSSGAPPKETVKRMAREGNPLLMEREFFQEAFEKSVRYHFPEYAHFDNMRIREGWKVVFYDDEVEFFYSESKAAEELEGMLRSKMWEDIERN